MAVTLTVLGSSDAFNAAGRGHACYLVEDPLGAVTIDFGPTAMGALKRLGRDPNQLDGVLLTHLHGDHFGGLLTFLVDAYYCSFRKRPFTIAGPVGTAARVRDLFKLAYRTIADTPPPFPLTITEYAPGQRLDLLGRSLTLFQADHQAPPEEVACSLRLQSGPTTLAFSGDTGWTENLLPVSALADLFVLECTFFQTAVPQHLNWKQIEPQLPRLTMKRLLLTHLSEEMRRHVEDVRKPGTIDVADDGLALTF